MRRTTLLALALCMFLAGGLVADDEVRGSGRISFLTGPQDGDAYEIVRKYLRTHRSQLGLSEADLGDAVIQDRYRTRHNGVTHIYLQQRFAGIDAFNGVMNINVAADGSIISLGNGFIPDLANKINVNHPTLSDAQAITAAAGHFDLTPTGLTLEGREGGAAARATYSEAGISRDKIPVELVWTRTADGVRLAWQTSLFLVDSPDYWLVRVDAVTGEFLSKNNWTSYDSYQVIPFPPFSDPEDSGGQSVIADPADLTASPFGWHDTNGAAGAESTETLGNNVDAHDDLDSNNTGGIRVDGGPTLDFLEVFDPALPPLGGTNLEAAIVNLFYANNVMHDLTYQYGFDEAAGNFQTNNYGNGGAANDAVQADAQDGDTDIGPNNATFQTPPDGFTPRMQMFPWISPFNATMTVNSPASIAGDYSAGQPDWGGALPVTGDVEEVSDGTAAPTQGCNALVGFTTGNVALIDRGGCEFGTKALNAENAGASAAIIVNDQQLPNGIIAMGAGADGGSVTIPAVMIGNADGTTIRSELAGGGGGVNVTLAVGGSDPDRDSDMDNGIIAHEYGHGISNRLTGGPANTSCLPGIGNPNISEQAGEGWSDFWTLALAAKAGDTATTSRGVGSYVIFEPVNGPGIRNFPYSTDLAVNPQTYGDIGTTNVPHGVGEIWAAMVWEVYWELVAKYGFDPDLYNGTGGNNLTIQLVIDGMKMQPCGPDFVEARDAILEADMVNNGGANECEIWRGFAKRGLGEAADPGANDPGSGFPIVGNETEDFTIPDGCDVDPTVIFTDGFESGDTSAWTATVNP